MATKFKNVTLPLAIFLVVLLTNLIFISKNYHFDSISLAMWAEQGQWYVEGQQQHILLTAINSLFYSLCSIFFPAHKAIVSLSAISCLAGALGAAYFFKTLNLLFQNHSH